jgi:hypothetical protein
MRLIHQTMLTFALLGVSGGEAVATARDFSHGGEGSRPSLFAQNASPLPLPLEETETVPDAEAPPAETDDGTVAPDTGTEEPGNVEDEFNLGEIPDIKSVELTLDVAKRALDTWLMVRDKYQDADLEAYDDLQEFVDKNEQGFAFETDIKSAGFVTVGDWNLAITSLSFAYNGILDDPTADITAQIAEIKADESVAQDLKDRMIASLSAMIPSENNKKIVQDLLADAAYKDKLEQLDTGGDDGE